LIFPMLWNSLITHRVGPINRRCKIDPTIKGTGVPAMKPTMTPPMPAVSTTMSTSATPVTPTCLCQSRQEKERKYQQNEDRDVKSLHFHYLRIFNRGNLSTLKNGQQPIPFTQKNKNGEKRCLPG
jgi:hypothetical protein